MTSKLQKRSNSGIIKFGKLQNCGITKFAELHQITQSIIKIGKFSLAINGLLYIPKSFQIHI